jgi:CDP-diacylglycerol--serine O-phosphatidyltransferase
MSKFRLRGKGRKDRKSQSDFIHVKNLLPNLVTSLAVCGGISAIVICATNYAKFLAGETVTNGDWTLALIALIFSCVCDAMDGRIARLLNASSKLGAELDSLADFVNFGVAPSLYLYFWVMSGPYDILPFTSKFLLACALFFSLCAAFRLARFNIMIEQPTLPYWKPFFLGVPAPGGCLMALTPVPLVLELSEAFPGIEVLQHPYVAAVILIIVGILMASRIPSLSLKTLRIKRNHILPITAGLLLASACLVANLWLTLGCIAALYFLTVPVVVMIFVRIREKYIREQGEGDNNK